MNTIARDTYEAMRKTHPFEAAFYERWIANGETRIVENTSNEGEKCSI